MPAALLCKTAFGLLETFLSLCGKPGTLPSLRVRLPQLLIGQGKSPVASSQAFTPELPGDQGKPSSVELSLRGSLLGFLSILVLRLLLCSLVSPASTLLNHLPAYPHFRVCFWENCLRPKSTREFCKTCFSTPPRRASAGMAEEACLDVEVCVLPLFPNRCVWEGSQPSGICSKSIKDGT